MGLFEYDNRELNKKIKTFNQKTTQKNSQLRNMSGKLQDYKNRKKKPDTYRFLTKLTRIYVEGILF